MSLEGPPNVRRKVYLSLNPPHITLELLFAWRTVFAEHNVARMAAPSVIFSLGCICTL